MEGPSVGTCTYNMYIIMEVLSFILGSLIIRSVPGSAVRDPVSSRPSESERLSHRLVGPHSQSMFIMADLRKMDR